MMIASENFYPGHDIRIEMNKNQIDPDGSAIILMRHEGGSIASLERSSFQGEQLWNSKFDEAIKQASARNVQRIALIYLTDFEVGKSPADAYLLRLWPTVHNLEFPIKINAVPVEHPDQFDDRDRSLMVTVESFIQGPINSP